MMKKLFLIVCMFFGAVHAQDKDYVGIDFEYQDQDSNVDYEDDDYGDDFIDIAYEELVYDVGMNLANQDLIVDIDTAKNALLSLYQNVVQVTQIVDLFMMIDDEIVELNITTMDELFEYELNNHESVMQACVAWLTAYQNMFIVFQSIHSENASLEVWCQDMLYFGLLVDDEQPTDPDYLELWQAGLEVLETQEVFEDALVDIE